MGEKEGGRRPVWRKNLEGNADFFIPFADDRIIQGAWNGVLHVSAGVDKRSMKGTLLCTKTVTSKRKN